MTYSKIWVITLRSPRLILPIDQYDGFSFKQMIEEVISENQADRKQIRHIPDMAYPCGAIQVYVNRYDAAFISPLGLGGVLLCVLPADGVVYAVVDQHNFLHSIVWSGTQLFPEWDYNSRF